MNYPAASGRGIFEIATAFGLAMTAFCLSLRGALATKQSLPSTVPEIISIAASCGEFNPKRLKDRGELVDSPPVQSQAGIRET
jgi:hypothetical protein